MKHFKHIIYSILILVTVMTTHSCKKALIGDKGTLEEDIYLNYKTQTQLQLPFEGEWYIFNGGRTHEDGAHHFVSWGSGQRYAIDVVIKKDGKSYSGDGTKNEDYYCFGKPLKAPAYGVVTGTENTIEDNIPGELNDDAIATGNYVMIDHLNGEHSLLAHFKKGTILVSVGDTVTAGQQLGETGNSGNSSEAHLHFHLQNSSKFLESTGLPAQFKNYYVNGSFTEEGEPTRGQVINE